MLSLPVFNKNFIDLIIHKKHFRFKYVLFLMLFILIFTGCSKETIRIGFIGDLSSKNSQLSIDGRNAVELQVRLINENGGIKGHQIQLIVKDDENKPDIALERHQEFLDEDVHFVLGHFHSNMSKAVIQSESVDLMFVSPSMSTTALSEQDDFFLRSGPINSNQAALFVEYALKFELEDIVIVYDLSNEEYTRAVAESVEMLMIENERSVKEIIAYNTDKDDLFELSKKLIQTEPKNLLVISQATDTAYIIQQVKKSIPDIGTYSVSWSMTKDLITNGGQSVEGTVFVGIFEPEEYKSEYIEFAKVFKDNYGYDLSFIGVLAYDSLNVLVSGLEEAEKMDTEHVKQSIIDIGEFRGLYNDFSIDRYGDNDRNYLMYKLEQGEFIPLRDWMD